MSRLLDLLGLEPSPLAIDYIENKQQFHLYSLLTEQRHPKTWNLSFVLQSDTLAGLRMLLSVDQDVSRKLEELHQDPSQLSAAADAVVYAIRTGHRIYVYGCGATGRLAKQMESSFWRPFWRKVRQHSVWKKLRQIVGDDIENALVGEMTGADRALVSSLEGFEDLQLIGRLQLQDHDIRRGDVVICVTEGGETSSVIGTILAALGQYGTLDEKTARQARSNLFFVCNNPVPALLPFARSASVLDNAAITHIDLTTGPQSITGSTRMQATTIETFVVGVILEEALDRLLGCLLTAQELADLGFGAHSDLTTRLQDFKAAKAAVDAAVRDIAAFTDLETATYKGGRFSTYFADQALITVFIDSTERSPTFRLYPLDKVTDPQRLCWVQVWTAAGDLHSAWRHFLGRPFRGLEPSLYQPAFETQVEDIYLRQAALRSLKSAGNDQGLLYDFSFSPANVERRGPGPGDLGVLVLTGAESHRPADPDTDFRKYIDLFHDRGGTVAVLSVAGTEESAELEKTVRSLAQGKDIWVPVNLDVSADPLGLRRQVALKMLLNAHSTAIMASLGRVVGNTMTSVSPSNLKLIGRASYLILAHVNDVLSQAAWRDRPDFPGKISFADANAVLVDAIDFVKSEEMGQTAEVALSIIRIIEALDRQTPVSWIEAKQIMEEEGLAAYLLRHNPSLRQAQPENHG
jgi:N-acetylmuramic acid 6-phosphate etherase